MDCRRRGVASFAEHSCVASGGRRAATARTYEALRVVCQKNNRAQMPEPGVDESGHESMGVRRSAPPSLLRSARRAARLELGVRASCIHTHT